MFRILSRFLVVLTVGILLVSCNQTTSKAPPYPTPTLEPVLNITPGKDILPEPPFPPPPGEADKSSDPVFFQDGVVVLMYHHIDPGEGSTSTMALAKFTSQLDMLKKNGYNVVSLPDVILFLEGKKEVPANSLAITFDDGYESFYRHAYPELRKRKMTAANFVIVGMIENSSAPLPARLTWAEIKEMQENGMSFFSHTYNSHDYFMQDAEGKRKLPALIARQYLPQEGRTENETEYRNRVMNDLVKAKTVLTEKLGQEVSVFSWPFGWGNRKVEGVLHEAGYKYAFTIKPGMVTRKSSFLGLSRLNAGNPKITPEMLDQGIRDVANGKLKKQLP